MTKERIQALLDRLETLMAKYGRQAQAAQDSGKRDADFYFSGRAEGVNDVWKLLEPELRRRT